MQIDSSGIKELLEPRLQDLLDSFGISYRDFSGYYSGTCPIHSSDNKNSLVIYKEGYIGSWKCFTNHCEEQYGGDILGLIWGLLDSTGRRHQFRDVLDWVIKFLGKPDLTFEKTVGPLILPRQYEENKKLVLRSKIMNIEHSQTFLKRGFSEGVLKKFDIHDCWNKSKELYGRTICPVYDESGQWLLGAWGRIIEDKSYLPKWKPNSGFKVNTFYGIWEAKKKIQETGKAILVEGMGDVLRLHEAGFTNALGLFGIILTDGQLKMLNRLGVSDIMILLDGDEAGIEGASRIKNKYGTYFNIVTKLLPEGKDPADFTIEEIRKIL